MSDTETKVDETNPEQEQEQEEPVGQPKGEVVVETQGQTYVLKTVEAKTGEEAEEVLLNLYASKLFVLSFIRRCKLYRWDEEECWKERGTGDLKILKVHSFSLSVDHIEPRHEEDSCIDET